MSEGPDRALLEAVHAFPGPYTVKAFGPFEQRFVDSVRDAARGAHQGAADIEVSARPSARGAHVCVTVTVVVEDADGVYALYRAVRAVDGVRMML